MLKVDVLNCMALAGAALSVMAIFHTLDRARLCAILGVLIAAASPLVLQIDWSHIPTLIKNYIAPDYAYFSFFPWAAFFVFGLSAGSVIRLLTDDQMDRAMLWAAVFGAALIIGGHYFSDLPYSLYTNTEFWLDSPAMVLMKLGALLWVLPFAFIWTRYAANTGWSVVSQLGTTSLLVYWVHIELVYGRWLGAWKESLDNTQVLALTTVVIILMVALSVLKTSAKKWSAMPASFRWYPFISRAN
jgi:fucose 4-O-acetylase-like acetyltransferase